MKGIKQTCRIGIYGAVTTRSISRVTSDNLSSIFSLDSCLQSPYVMVGVSRLILLTKSPMWKAELLHPAGCPINGHVAEPDQFTSLHCITAVLLYIFNFIQV